MRRSFEQLIEEHQSLVITMAKSIHRKMPPHIQYDDILSYGQLGLAQAARTYQPTEGATFATYAYYRIQGAIYDGISRLNWTSRATYRRLKREQLANEVLKDQNDSLSPTASMHETAEWLFDTTSKLAVVYLSSSFEEGSPISEAIEDSSAKDPGMQAQESELLQRLRKLIENLPENDRDLINMTYFQGMSLAAAAEKIGKSKSWASRTHSRILKDLGSQLDSQGASSKTG